nr:unnamed protein product [Callosobruchus chinensis]
MQSREGQLDSSVTRPHPSAPSRFLSGVLLVTSLSSTGFKRILLLRADDYNSAALQTC